MKKRFVFIIPLLAVLSLTSCDLVSDIFGGDNSNTHSKSYEPITGKFVLYEALDKRVTYTNTYFDIDGSKDNFSLKYYENGVLKKEGSIVKLVTRENYIGSWSDNLHFNVKIGDKNEHIAAYTESFDPLNQFRIINESYNPGEVNYYLSEMPFVMGTYVRDSASYVAEKYHTNTKDYIAPTQDEYTCGLNGTYKLDDDHYFYFLSPKAWHTPNGLFFETYFQYFAPVLNKPFEGWVRAVKYGNTPSLAIKDREHKDGLWFGYYTFDEKDNMYEHWGTVNFANGEVTSLTFEHISRAWSEKEWDDFTKDESYHMPDPIIYEYAGGTYTKANS